MKISFHTICIMELLNFVLYVGLVAYCSVAKCAFMHYVLSFYKCEQYVFWAASLLKDGIVFHGIGQ